MGSTKLVCENQMRMLRQIEAQEHVLERRDENRGKLIGLAWVTLIIIYVLI